MMQPGRRVNPGGYEFGFNEQMKDNEWEGKANVYSYGERMYNSRIGRFTRQDPLDGKYPMLSAYQFASNTPIQAVDLGGLEAWNVNNAWGGNDIERFNKFVKARSEEARNEGECYTCEDFVISNLIDFASQNNLPVTIKTGAGTYSASSEQFSSVKGFKDVVFDRAAASDLQRKENTKSKGKDLDKAEQGDIILLINRKGEATHSQQVTEVNDNKITVYQGDEADYGSSNPDPVWYRYYAGKRLERRTYTLTDEGYDYSSVIVRNPELRTWNFQRFNMQSNNFMNMMHIMQLGDMSTMEMINNIFGTSSSSSTQTGGRPRDPHAPHSATTK